MSDAKAYDLFEASDDLFADEDPATLEAIDAGIRASDAGKIVALDEVRKLIPLWISKYSLRNQR